MIVVIVIAVCVGLDITNIFRQREIRRLKERYRRLTFASPKVAGEALRLQIVRWKNIAPGHSEKWYLERLIRELEGGRISHRQ